MIINLSTFKEITMWNLCLDKLPITLKIKDSNINKYLIKKTNKIILIFNY